jgi:hypothetical protein
MRKILITSILIQYFWYTNSVSAQKIDAGVLAGTNINFLSLKSAYTISDNVKVQPEISYEFGGFVKSNFRRLNLLCTFEYLSISNRVEPDFRMTGSSGEDLTVKQSSIFNHSLFINVIGTVYIFRKLYVGAGISGNILLWSTYFAEDEYNSGNGQALSQTNKIGFYKRFVAAVPVTVGYDFKRINLFARFNKGFMNRLKDKGFIKEIDNTLTFGIGCRLNKRKSN